MESLVPQTDFVTLMNKKRGYDFAYPRNTLYIEFLIAHYNILIGNLDISGVHHGAR